MKTKKTKTKRNSRRQKCWNQEGSVCLFGSVFVHCIHIFNLICFRFATTLGMVIFFFFFWSQHIREHTHRHTSRKKNRIVIKHVCYVGECVHCDNFQFSACKHTFNTKLNMGLIWELFSNALPIWWMCVKLWWCIRQANGINGISLACARTFNTDSIILTQLLVTQQTLTNTICVNTVARSFTLAPIPSPVFIHSMLVASLSVNKVKPYFTTRKWYYFGKSLVDVAPDSLSLCGAKSRHILNDHINTIMVPLFWHRSMLVLERILMLYLMLSGIFVELFNLLPLQSSVGSISAKRSAHWHHFHVYISHFCLYGCVVMIEIWIYFHL